MILRLSSLALAIATLAAQAQTPRHRPSRQPRCRRSPSPAGPNSAGNRRAALPFSVALRDARLCERQLGELSDADLARWSAACGRP